ncbi:uncharacterized protein GGS25DRAFT_530680 [Hypoxylon fragiforme]|uniref:uncharacterized protein n=1 Tax=Hypoxylon fragiforme TaxID=63214 RepID=UPI0020C5FC7B|nr:uncharacterized protein GGS25DRAFT_530680 [Hypoxylon fragiforme]KAI2609576.1 hypothetical protein GGS25DRAFT_530680 [Hypoxylon fragiforme]
MNSNKTLRDLLTQQKPVFENYVRRPSYDSYDENFPTINDVRLWNAFNMDYLKNSDLSLILDYEIPHQKESHITNQQDDDDNSPDTAYFYNQPLIAQNAALMEQALTTVISHHKGSAGKRLWNTWQDGYHTTVFNIPGVEDSLLDHIIALDSDGSRRALVAGIGRPNRRFQANQLLSPNSQRRKLQQNCVHILAQLAHVCAAVDITYGYIQTEAQLVVCHFIKSEKANTMDVEIMPIPMSPYEKKEFTADLGLFWLCMMSFSDDYQPLTCEAKVEQLLSGPQEKYGAVNAAIELLHNVASRSDGQAAETIRVAINKLRGLTLHPKDATFTNAIKLLELIAKIPTQKETNTTDQERAGIFNHSTAEPQNAGPSMNYPMTGMFGTFTAQPENMSPSMNYPMTGMFGTFTAQPDNMGPSMNHPMSGTFNTFTAQPENAASFPYQGNQGMAWSPVTPITPMFGTGGGYPAV